MTVSKLKTLFDSPLWPLLTKNEKLNFGLDERLDQHYDVKFDGQSEGKKTY